MDPEKRAKRESLRIIISESVMVIAIIAVVAVLALIVSGYWISSDFKGERQGMLQVSSVPTGATVAIDGESAIFQRTNISKVLSSGEHEIVLTKDEYDSWSKTINVREGLLYRLHYPRLFLLDREKKTVYDTVGATFATISPNRKRVLLANDTTAWTLLNLDSDNLEPKTLDVSKLFSSVSLADGAISGVTTTLQAAQIAKDAQVKQLVIGHFSARYIDESGLLEEAKSVFPNTLLAHEDLSILVND